MILVDFVAVKKRNVHNFFCLALNNNKKSLTNKKNPTNNKNKTHPKKKLEKKKASTPQLFYCTFRSEV